MKIIGKLFAHLLAGILTLVLVVFDLLGRALSFIGLFAVCLLVFYGTAWIAGLLAALRDRLLAR